MPQRCLHVNPSRPPPQIAPQTGEEFTLAPGQEAAMQGTGLIVSLTGVPDDQRCPLKIECAMSGPVTVTIEIAISPVFDFVD